MRIPDDKIDEVRNANDIVDVISGYVSLKRRGKNYLGLCPFHQEKTPSFNVSQDRQMYHCFGCGVGGNVFTFIMEHDKVSFVEAVRMLAERVGITLPDETTAGPQATENEVLYAACRMAGRFFYDNLTATPEGKVGLDYFHARGFTDETIRKFGLGYTLHSWDSLMRHAEKEQVSAAVLERAGLALRREDGSGYYDRFRGRAMFPIFSPSGRTIAFGARKMREDDPLGKYINSPETPIYSKSRQLYGLYQAKEAIREKEFAILVEGYADLISVFQAGIQNVVASSGTALTEEQAKLIGRYARDVTLVYDGDSAGSKAMLRGVDVIIENGLDVKVAELPQGDDPDSFVRTHGGPAFRKLLEGAVSFLDFKLSVFRERGMLATAEGKTRAVRSVVETIARTKDELKRSFFIKSLAEKYGIPEGVLYRELERSLGRALGVRASGAPSGRTAAPTTAAPASAAAASTAPSAPAAGGSSQRGVIAPDAPARRGTAAAAQAAEGRQGPPAPQRDLLKLMLEHGDDLVRFVFTFLTPEMFTYPDIRKVIDVVLREAEAGTDWNAQSVVDSLEDPKLKHFVSGVLMTRYELGRGWRETGNVPRELDPYKIAEDAIVRLRILEIDRMLQDAGRAFKDAEQRGEDVKAYRDQIRTLQEERRELQTTGLGGHS